MSASGKARLEDFGKFSKAFAFTVLHHVLPARSSRPSHWDLLLEHPDLEPGKVLCFEAPIPPSMWSSHVPLVRLPNHRRLYLTYEGPVSENRGTVTQVLSGSLLWSPANSGCLLANIQRFSWKNKGPHSSLRANCDHAVLILEQDLGSPSSQQWLTTDPGSSESWTLSVTDWPEHNT
jgi:hypothetical protein